jgi:ABC-type phosphate/phosphonate transport system substrate-binding protein
VRFVSLMADNMDFFYRLLVDWLSHRAGVAIEVEDCMPWQERERMLDRGEAHIGFICGLPYVRKVDRRKPLVELLAAPVMQRPRYDGRPIYFSDVVVRADSPLRGFADLCGASWAYNEPGSQSGYNLTRFYLASLGERSGYFGNAVESGSHQSSIEMVMDGLVDASAIDSTVLELELELRPQLAAVMRVIHTLGPSPAPPAVVSTKVPTELRRKLRRMLLTMHNDPCGERILGRAGIARFTSVSDADYNPIRRMARLAEGIRLTVAQREGIPLCGGRPRQAARNSRRRSSGTLRLRRP